MPRQSRDLRRAVAFFDDGGTPAWRARQAVVIDVPGHSLRGWWRRTTPAQLLVLGFVGVSTLLWGVWIGGLLLAYVVTALLGF